MEERRIKLKCWHPECQLEYTLFKRLNPDEQPRLVVECPFCEHVGVVDLAPWRTERTDIFKSEGGSPAASESVLDLPDVLPTTKPEE